jgi:hypothetical protein
MSLDRDQAEQMRVGKPGQRGASRNQFFDPLGHCRRRRNRIAANSLWRIGDSEGTGDCGDPTLCLDSFDDYWEPIEAGIGSIPQIS